MSRRPAFAAVLVVLVSLVGCGSKVPLGTPEGSGATALTVPTYPGATASGSASSPTASSATPVSGGSTSAVVPSKTGSRPATSAASTASSSSPTGTPGGHGGAPIQIGFLNTGISNAASFGVGTGQTVAAQSVFQALVKYFNAHGGLDGRQIVPVVAQTDTADSSWAADYQAACQTFTQDHHVAAVIGYSFAYINNFEACMSKAGVPHITGGYATGDKGSYREYPYMVSTTGISDDRRYLVQLELGVREGLLKPGDKVGILLDNCPEEMRAYNTSVVPYLKAQHLVGVLESEGCPQGASDDASAITLIQAAVLKFRSLGVNKLLLEGPPILVFALEAQAQGWRPTYLLTSASGGASLDGTLPVAQEANMHGAGWMPEVDVSVAHQPPKTAPERACLAMLKHEGIVPRQYNDYLYAYTTCDGFSLYETALEHDGDSTAAPQIVSAISGLGRSWHGASMIDGATDFTTTRRDGPAQYREWGWSGSCRCFAYTGAARALP